MLLYSSDKRGGGGEHRQGGYNRGSDRELIFSSGVWPAPCCAAPDPGPEHTYIT